MPVFIELLSSYAESIELPEGLRLYEGVPSAAFGKCIIRQAQNYTIETKFVVKKGEPMMIINPLMFPERKKCLTVKELKEMDFHCTHNSEELNSALDSLVSNLCNEGYGKLCGNSDTRSDKDYAIVENWVGAESKRLMPDWFIKAMEISNEMQYDCCDFSEISLITEWKLKASFFLSSFLRNFVPGVIGFLLSVIILFPKDFVHIMSNLNKGFVIVVSVLAIAGLLYLIVSILKPLIDSLDD